MNTEYYHDSGISTILNAASRKEIGALLESKRCAQCGGELGLYVSVDSSCVICLTDMYGHNAGFDIDMDFPRHDKPPRLIQEEGL